MQGAVEIRIPSTSGIAGYVATQGELLNIHDAYEVFYLFIFIFSLMISFFFFFLPHLHFKRCKKIIINFFFLHK